MVRLKFPAQLFILSLLAALLLGGCGGVLEVKIEQLPSGAPAPLGQVAYIFGGDVWVLDLDSGVRTRMTRDGRNLRPRLSQDGNWVAYLKGDQLYVGKLPGGEGQLLSEAGLSDYVWSPEGSGLAYASTNGMFVWDGNTESTRALFTDLAPIRSLAWHPAGEWIALDTLEGARRQVLKISPDGQNQTSLYSTEGLMDVPRLAGWSTDGRWLALWVGSRATAAGQDGLPLCLVPGEGGDPACLDELALLWSDYLSWSPDGQLAFIAGPGRETWVGKGLALLEPGTMTLQALIPAAEQAPLHPAWSPDGGQIVYSAGPATPLDEAYALQERALRGRHIWVFDAAGGRRAQLTGDAGYRDERPLWSADGSQIMFVRVGDQSASLWLMSAEGSDLRQVVAELTPRPDPQGEYGYIDWGDWWDWRRP